MSPLWTCLLLVIALSRSAIGQNTGPIAVVPARLAVAHQHLGSYCIGYLYVDADEVRFEVVKPERYKNHEFRVKRSEILLGEWILLGNPQNATELRFGRSVYHFWLLRGDAANAPSTELETPPVLPYQLLIAVIQLGGVPGQQMAGARERTDPGAARAPTDPEALLQNAIKVVDACRSHYRQTGDFQSMSASLAPAETDAQAAYEQFLRQGDLPHAAQSLVTVADIERMLSVQAPEQMQVTQTPVAQKYKEALELAIRANYPESQFKALAGLSRSEMNSKDYVSASGHIAQMIELASKSGNKDDLVDAYDMNGELEQARGNLSAASDSLNRAAAMAGEVKDQFLLWSVYSDRSDLYNDRSMHCNYERDFDSCQKAAQIALDDCQQALGVAQRAGFGFLAASSGNRLRDLKLSRDMQKQQAGMQSKPSAYAFRISKPSQVVLCPRFTTGQDPVRAGPLRLIYNERAGFINNYEPDKYYLEGLIEEMEGNDDGALRNYLQAVKLLEEDRRKTGDVQGSGSFLSDRIEIYYAAAQQRLDRKQYAEAFDLLERSRSRAMAELLAGRELSLPSAQDRDLFAQLVRLKAQIGQAQNKLFNLAGAGTTDADEQSKELQTKIDQLKAQDRDLQLSIEQRSPKLRDIVGEKAPVSLNAVQAAARRGHYEVLYYLATSSGLIVWHIGPDSVQVVKPYYPRPLLVDHLAKLNESLSDPHSAFDEADATELFLVLVNPVLLQIKSQRLIIIPHEDLNHLPFQALKNPADNSFLGERFQISYAPSATILSELGDTPDFAHGHLLAVADPGITNAVGEVNAIGNLYPERSKIVASTLASKQDLKTWSGDYNLIHLSVHGVFDANDPLLSYLRLYPRESAEGRFSAAEMFGLKLPKNSLVVLSACETGRTQVTHASEVHGMMRGLLYSGASTLVLSSWRVDARSTALWMETFYREAQTKPPAQAAQLALLAVKQRPEYQHPFYWAPFLVTGP